MNGKSPPFLAHPSFSNNIRTANDPFKKKKKEGDLVVGSDVFDDLGPLRGSDEDCKKQTYLYFKGQSEKT